MSDGEQFVKEIRRRVIAANLEHYAEMIGAKPADEVKNEDWNFILRAVQEGGDAGTKAILGVIRHVMANTTANIFAVLDGSTAFEEMSDDFHLTYSDRPEEINRGLCDQFWEQEEDEGLI